MLYEHELKTFVEGTTNFFEVAAQQPATIGSPYLMEGSPSVHEYTGVINISGKREGVVYFTAPKAMLTVLLMKMQEARLQSQRRCATWWARSRIPSPATRAAISGGTS